LSKAVDIVRVAHPVGSHLAELAFPTRYDLFTNGVIANLQAIEFSGAIPKSDNFTDKLVAGRNRSLTVADAVFITPEQCRASIAFDVTRTDTGAGHPN
jgi:hypothetical protein